MNSSFTVSGLILMVSTIIISIFFSMVMLSAASSLGDSSSAASLSFKVETKVKIVFVDKVSSSTVEVWVKNIGGTVIPLELVEKSTLIFGPVGDFEVIPYGEVDPPFWTYTLLDLDGDGKWGPSETLRLRVGWTGGLADGDYYVKFSLHGVCEDYLYVKFRS